MDSSTLIVEVRDRYLNRVGMIPQKDLVLTYEGTLYAIGTWTLELASDHIMAAALAQRGAGIIVQDTRTPPPFNVIFSGPVDSPEFVSTNDDPGGTITFSGLDDNTYAGDRIIYPYGNPDTTGTDKQYGAHYVLNNKAAADMLALLVKANASLSANEVGRRQPLVTDTAYHFGGTAKGTVLSRSYRYDNLLTSMAEVGVAGGVNFRMVQPPGGLIRLETWLPVDRTQSVRLSSSTRSIDSQRVQTQAPTITRAVVAGQGNQAKRTVVPITSAASTQAETDWGRIIESFIDRRDTNKTAELLAAGNEALAEGGATGIVVEAIPSEHSTMRYGVDWQMGDLVTVIVNGTEYKVTVAGVVIKADTDGVRTGVRLGSDYRRGVVSNAVTAALYDLNSRVGSLERGDAPVVVDPGTVVPSSSGWTITYEQGNGHATIYVTGSANVSNNTTVDIAAAGALPEAARPAGSAIGTAVFSSYVGYIVVRTDGSISVKQASGATRAFTTGSVTYATSSA